MEVPSVSIEWFRDLTIIIFVLVAMGVLIFITVLCYGLYRRMRAALESIKITTTAMAKVSTYVKDNVAGPLIEVAAFIEGVRQGIRLINKLVRKGGRDD